VLTAVPSDQIARLSEWMNEGSVGRKTVCRVVEESEMMARVTVCPKTSYEIWAGRGPAVLDLFKKKKCHICDCGV